MEKNRVKELEIGKDYIDRYGSGILIIERKGDINNYYFYDDEFKWAGTCQGRYRWREATEEEVIEAFEKHLLHRFGEDWRTMKIKEEHPASSLAINTGTWEVEIVKSSDGWNVWNKNGLLYRNGIWGERLKDIKAMNKKEKSDKKRYEVIKTTLSDFKQVSLGDNKTNKVIAINQDTLLLEKIYFEFNGEIKK